MKMTPIVSIIMGSTSDLPVMEKAAQLLNDMHVPFEMNALSAHRTPEAVEEFAKNARSRGIKVIIAAAGMAAALPGVIAANTTLPVIGVPVKGSVLDGVDALYSIIQMPPGIPVATVAINGAMNAAILAAKILAASDPELLEKLKAYSESDFYAFHMPGHKRNKALLGIELPYDLDITEIDGFDDLHHADGILKEEQERAARVFGAEESHFLVNGSTAGILSAVMGCTHRGDKILVARHCHKSIYHAIYMNGLVPRYVYPEFDISMHMNGEISKEDVAKALAAEPDIKAVVIVSPNYDGVVSDVKGIAEVAHSYRIPLIVDEAHGPHFGFHPAFPGRANDLGADVVINSLHKTLPSLTQTAILHINGKLANRRRIKKYLDMLQSSSPSYIFMASLDACVDFLDGKCEEAFELYVERLQKFREELKPLQHLQILRTEHYDISKVVISTANANITSPELADRLRKEYHLEMEMCGADYVTAIAAIGDSKKGLKRLKKALLEIDKELEKNGNICNDDPDENVYSRHAKQVMPVFKAMDGEKEAVPLKESCGRICGEFAYIYPPGIPLLAPGEQITEEILKTLQDYIEKDLPVQGLEDTDLVTIQVMALSGGRSV